VWSRLEKKSCPRLGSRPVAEIESLEVVAMLRAISDRGVADLAKRVMQVTSAVFRYAVTHNPAANFKPGDILPATEKTNYARVSGKELPKLLHALDAYPSLSTRLAMQFMAHTFVRTSELIGAKWEEIDVEQARWDIPAERMKKKTPHIIPQSQQALAVLEQLRRSAPASRYSAKA
jgi:integrase